MRGLGALVVLVALAGCGGPPALNVASLVLDGVSFLATGKSVGDHALSIVTQQDCAMWRILKERDLKAVCRDDDETAVAADDRPPPAANRVKPSDDRILAAVAAADPGARVPEVAARDPVVLEPIDARPPPAADLVKPSDDRILAAVTPADSGAVARLPKIGSWDSVVLKPVVLEPAANAPPASAVAEDDWPPPASNILKPSDDRILAASFVAPADLGARVPEFAAWDPVVLGPAANASPAADLLNLGDDRILAASFVAAADPGARMPEVAAWDFVVLGPAAADGPPAADFLKPSDDRILVPSFVAAADPGAVARLPEVAAWDPVVPEPAANAPPAFADVSWPPPNRKATYLVAGSFRHMGRAERLTESLGGYPATIKSAVVMEQTYYRVLTGPYSGDEIAAARERLTMSGVGNHWAISLCIADLGPPPCGPPQVRLPKSYGLSADLLSPVEAGFAPARHRASARAGAKAGGFGPQAGRQVEEISGLGLAVD